MELVLFIVFGGAIAFLWQRVDRLEAELRTWQGWEPQSYPAAVPAEPAAASAPAPAMPLRAAPAQEPDEAPDAEAEREPIPAQRIAPEPAASASAGADSESWPQPAPAAEAEPDHAAAETYRARFDFEEIFGRLLPIWAGGIALAIAGFFLVRYSIEAGLLTPPVRVALGFAFGLALVAGAELAYRFERLVADERVCQALAGAGLATLYASFYLAGSHYGLIGSTLAFLGLAGVTAAAIGLSFRFGVPSAVLGLVGGFAAPLLVGSDEANVPLLALYLALVTAGLTFTGRQQNRSWLSLAALGGGLGWGVLLLLAGVPGDADIVALGGYLVLLGVVLPAFSARADGPLWLRIGAAAVAALQLAGMVAEAGHSLLAWSLYLLIGAALAFFGWREPRMREAGAVAGAIGLVLAASWFAPPPGEFAIVLGGLTAVFAAVPLAHIWRDRARLVDIGQLAGFALLAIALCQWHFAKQDVEPLLALVAFGFALLPAIAAWLRWVPRDRELGIDALIPLAAAAIALFAAGLIATPVWAAPLVGGAVTGGLFWLGTGRERQGLVEFAWAGALATLFALFAWSAIGGELFALLQGGGESDYLRSPLRWAFACAPLVWLALRERRRVGRHASQFLAAGTFYALGAQIVPGDALAWFAALAFASMVALRPGWRAGQATLLAVATIWGLSIGLPWVALGAEALAGEPMLVAGAIALRDVALFLLPVAAASAAFIARRGVAGRFGKAVAGIGALAAIVALHIGFKHVLGIDDLMAFTDLGMVERMLWQALLVAGAAAAAMLAKSRPWSGPVACALFGLALAHFALFSLGWHNPLWAPQSVGAWPVANWLVPAYATGFAALAGLHRLVSTREPSLRPAIDAAMMLVIVLFGLSELRQLFSGSLLTSVPVGQLEDVLRSVLGIVLAVGFLAWGSRRDERSWRIGSLVVMLLAVLKVFLLDAAALEGLARIASFMALGFSLIGIGWFYTRQLKRSSRPEPEMA